MDNSSDVGLCLSREQIKMLPTSLESATIRMMRPDSIAREPEIFGNAFVDHYGGTREHEVRLWNQAVTNWEGVHSAIAVCLL
jgi:glutamine synthetase